MFIYVWLERIRFTFIYINHSNVKHSFFLFRLNEKVCMLRFISRVSNLQLAEATEALNNEYKINCYAKIFFLLHFK